MKAVTLLGATGSIGRSTLDVLRRHKDEFCLHAAACHGSADKMLEIIREFKPQRVALSDPNAAAKIKSALKDLNLSSSPDSSFSCEVLSGEEGVCEIAGDGEAFEVIDAIVGAAGLKPVMAAVRTGCRIGLANKEALVMSGLLFFDEVKKYGARVLPIDSEHSAICQCLPEALQQDLGFCDLPGYGVRKILLTGSGGPFRTTPIEELEHVTAAQAVAHPVWSMGPKISVDSATMMNKGLEFIEARYLFNAKASDIEVLIHPQSVVHSMVAFLDGAVMAQLGKPDMRTPISRALGFPGRLSSGVDMLDFVKAGEFNFTEPDFKRYPCLKLAIDASAQGQGATTALNAANETAVAAFLEGKIGYLDIYKVCDMTLSRLDTGNIYSLEEIFDTDAKARALAAKIIGDSL